MGTVIGGLFLAALIGGMVGMVLTWIVLVPREGPGKHPPLHPSPARFKAVYYPDQDKYANVPVDHFVTKQYWPGWVCTRQDGHTGPCALYQPKCTKSVALTPQDSLDFGKPGPVGRDPLTEGWTPPGGGFFFRKSVPSQEIHGSV